MTSLVTPVHAVLNTLAASAAAPTPVSVAAASVAATTTAAATAPVDAAAAAAAAGTHAEHVAAGQHVAEDLAHRSSEAVSCCSSS